MHNMDLAFAYTDSVSAVSLSFGIDHVIACRDYCVQAMTNPTPLWLALKRRAIMV